MKRIRFDIRISLIDKLLAIEAGWLEGNEQDGYIYLRLRSTGTVNGATKGMDGNGNKNSIMCWEWWEFPRFPKFPISFPKIPKSLKPLYINHSHWEYGWD